MRACVHVRVRACVRACVHVRPCVRRDLPWSDDEGRMGLGERRATSESNLKIAPLRSGSCDILQFKTTEGSQPSRSRSKRTTVGSIVQPKFSNSTASQRRFCGVPQGGGAYCCYIDTHTNASILVQFAILPT